MRRQPVNGPSPSSRRATTASSGRNRIRDLRIGILGAGRMGTRHARFIASTGARISVVGDSSREAADQLARIVGAPVSTARADEFFDRKLDAVVIATPPSMRVPAILAACERRAHLFIEKPCVLTLGEGRRCLSRIERAGILAAVGFQFRYAPVFERMKALVADEAVHVIRSLGTETYYLTYYMPLWKLNKDVSGGVVAEQTSHLLDLARFLLGNAKPVRGLAIGAKTMALERADCDVENALQVVYELEPRVFGVHTAHCGTSGYSVEMEVVGPHVRLRNFGPGEIVGFLYGKPFREPAPATNSIGLGKVGAWLRAIETEDPTLIRSPFSDALHTVALCEAAESSLGEGRFVRAGTL